MATVDFKSKTTSILPANGFMQKKQRNAVQDKQAIAKAIGKSGDQRRGMLLFTEKEEAGGATLNKSPLEESKVRGGASFSLAEFVAGQGEILPSACCGGEVGFFLLGLPLNGGA